LRWALGRIIINDYNPATGSDCDRPEHSIGQAVHTRDSD
jgi:hypothetical protein